MKLGIIQPLERPKVSVWDSIRGCLREEFLSTLTDFEKVVFEGYIMNLSYREIQNKFSEDSDPPSAKAIDNAIFRVRRKKWEFEGNQP
jgi:hypothetical protein